MMVRSNTVSLTVVSTSSTQLSDMTKSNSVIRNERYVKTMMLEGSVIHNVSNWSDE